MYFLRNRIYFQFICIIAFLTFSISNSVYAEDINDKKNSCFLLLNLNANTPFGEIHPWFLHNSEYDVEVKNFTIKNQCATGHCHLYAWASELESKTGIEISNTYIDAMNIYNVAVDSLTESLTSLVFGTLSLTNSRKRIRDMGIIPASVWQGDNKFIKSKSYNKLTTAIEMIVVNYLEKIKTAPIEQRPAIFYDFKNIIYQMINQVAGPFPNEFTYEGQTYTPKTFAALHFPELELPLVQVTVDPDKYGASAEKINDSDFNTLTISASRLNAENIIKKVLDSGRAVYFAYNHESQFIDEETGIISIGAFSYPPMATLVDRKMMDQHNKWKGNHAVLIVGYQMDENSMRVKKWKIQNSWGPDAGDNGFFHMYQDYMDIYGWGFSFVDDGSIDLNSFL